MKSAGDRGELTGRGAEVLHGLCGDDIGIGKIGAVFEAFVFQPEERLMSLARQSYSFFPLTENKVRLTLRS